MVEEERKEEKKVTFIHLQELKEVQRLFNDEINITNQYQQSSNKPLIKDVFEKAKTDTLMYLAALGKKYGFNPEQSGIDKNTGEVRPLPKEIQEANKPRFDFLKGKTGKKKESKKKK